MNQVIPTSRKDRLEVEDATLIIMWKGLGDNKKLAVRL